MTHSANAENVRGIVTSYQLLMLLKAMQLLATMTEALPAPKSAAMSTPHLTKTFDTSLVDVQRSFSSTETAPSESSIKENRPASQQQQPSSREFQTVTTEELYAQWASVSNSPKPHMTQSSRIAARRTTLTTTSSKQSMMSRSRP